MKMPVLFVGHGTPMNAIENNEFSDGWVALTKKIHRPKDILVISAHWYTDHLGVNDQEEPEQIYDMYGFPKELYELKYPVKGSLDLAETVQSLLGNQVSVDNTWGIDHGTWSVLKWMYPEGDIPVVQLSINKNLSVNEHYELGQKLSALRDQGTLIVGSGNVVHNLRAMDYHHAGGYPWAVEFDYYIKEAVINHNHDLAIHYQQAGDCHKQAFYTLEHFLPLIYVLGAAKPEDSVTVFNESCFGGSLSMTSYLIGI